MKTSYIQFSKGLSDLKHYIEGLEVESQILSSLSSCRKVTSCKTSVKEYKLHWSKAYITKKRFNYNSIIVSLYGYFEQYIENLIYTYSKTINEIVPSYESLAQSIQSHHLRLSLELIKKAEQARYRDKISTNKVIENLNLCLNDCQSYRLNSDAFTQHTANFRSEIINENFKFVGLDNICGQVLSKKIFINYLMVLPQNLWVNIRLWRPEQPPCC